MNMLANFLGNAEEYIKITKGKIKPSKLKGMSKEEYLKQFENYPSCKKIESNRK